VPDPVDDRRPGIRHRVGARGEVQDQPGDEIEDEQDQEGGIKQAAFVKPFKKGDFVPQDENQEDSRDRQQKHMVLQRLNDFAAQERFGGRSQPASGAGEPGHGPEPAQRVASDKVRQEKKGGESRRQYDNAVSERFIAVSRLHSDFPE
jgi:hypothetical protein